MPDDKADSLTWKELSKSTFLDAKQQLECYRSSSEGKGCTLNTPLSVLTLPPTYSREDEGDYVPQNAELLTSPPDST